MNELRELKDRSLGQINATPLALTGKYDVSRALPAAETVVAVRVGQAGSVLPAPVLPGFVPAIAA